MAQITAVMEAACQGLRRLQARGAAIDPADLEAWERDFHKREVEFQCRSEQLQLAMFDAGRQAEATTTEERRYGVEAAALATREAELAQREAEAASRAVALDVRALALTNREETAHREVAAAATAKDQAAEASGRHAIVSRWRRGMRPPR